MYKLINENYRTIAIAPKKMMPLVIKFFSKYTNINIKRAVEI